jgi:hypothetical protein
MIGNDMNINADYVTIEQTNAAIARMTEFVLANEILGYTKEDLEFTISEPGLDILAELRDIIRHGMDYPNTEDEDWS